MIVIHAQDSEAGDQLASRTRATLQNVSLRINSCDDMQQ